MTQQDRLSTLVASGQASLLDMQMLGDEQVASIKTNPQVLQIRAKSSDPISTNEERRQISYLVSDETPDRMGDIIKVKGWDLASYKRNPVVLWSHDGQRTPPIGKSVNVRRRYGPARLTSDIEFAPREAHEFADTIYQLAKGGFIRATSVGFMPTEAGEVDEKQREKLGLGKYGTLYTGAELMEISVVAVPANPSALEEGVKSLVSEGALERGMAARFFSVYPKDEESALKKVRAACRSFVDMAANQLADGIAPPADCFSLEHKGAIPPHKTAKAPVGQDWDADAVWRSINDEYEGEAKANRFYLVAAYRVDDANPETRAAYKYPHHDVDGKVVWRGITAAMAALNGARGGGSDLSEADRKGIYRHLVEHYEQFEEEAPALRAIEEVEEKTPACRMEGETTDECVSRKVPELIDDEGMDSDQAVAAAHSMCETPCGDKNKSDERLVEAMASLIEQQAEQTMATRQLVDSLTDLTKTLRGDLTRGGTEGGSVHEPDAGVPDADEPSPEQIERLVNSAFRGFAERIGRDIRNDNLNANRNK